MFRIVALGLALTLSSIVWLPAHGANIPVVVAPGGSAPPPVVMPVMTPSKAVGQTHNCSSYYPEAALAANETGDVVVGYDVGISGALTNIKVAKSSGNATLDTAALKCVREHWRNTPAMQGTTPVASPNHQATIGFHLL
jgi:TonB family protein